MRIQCKAGDVRTHFARDIWNRSAVIRNLRDMTFSRLKQCAGCQDSAYCNPCPGLAVLERGSLVDPAEECCRQASIRKQLYSQLDGTSNKRRS
ncbi:hypothetical protein JXJ21_14150 [candidate division KSB1 bacterium]|nr:hypothetical protein [candidate division KSB1 bacterium]